MEPHPIPRQITTFEFKLIGFMTLRQFIYLAIFIPLGFVFYYLVPIPILNLLIAFSIGALGPLFAFVPYNERTLDVWVQNLFRKLFSPSQFYYHKKNSPPDFLRDFFITLHPQKINDYSNAQRHLRSYLDKTKTNVTSTNQKTIINQLLSGSINLKTKKNEIQENKNTALTNDFTGSSLEKKPFIFGVVKNNKNVPLPNILVYIKKKDGENIRILKTNSHGYFVTFHPFPAGNYFLEIKDLNHHYFFDTMEILVNPKNNQSLNIVSKEQL